MPHAKADVMAAINDAHKALDKVNAILRGSIAANERAVSANENAMRGLCAVSAYVKEEEALELRQEDIPAAKTFFKDLAEKISAAAPAGG